MFYIYCSKCDYKTANHNDEEDAVFRVVGDVGLVLGSFKEKFKPKGGELQTIEVRTSMTFIRVDDKWKLAIYHRDTQFAK